MFKQTILDPPKAPLLIILFIAFVSAVFCYDNADYYSYTLIYDYYTPLGLSNAEIVDWGFSVLCKIFYNIGCSYEVFRGIYISIACIILYKSILYFTNKSNLPILLYLIFPFALDVVQMRYMFALSIIFYSLRFLKEGKISKYIIGVIVASTQQMVVVIYLVLIMTVIDKEKIIKIIKIIFALELLIFLKFSSFLDFLIKDNFSHYNSYLSYDQYSKGLALLYIVMSVSLIHLTQATCYSKPKSNIDFSRSIILVSVLLVPFIFINENFTRLYRGMIPFIYIGLENSKKIFNNKSDNTFVAVLYCFIMFYIHLSPHNVYHWEHVLLPLFTKNYFWDMIL